MNEVATVAHIYVVDDFLTFVINQVYFYFFNISTTITEENEVTFIDFRRLLLLHFKCFDFKAKVSRKKCRVKGYIA